MTIQVSGIEVPRCPLCLSRADRSQAKPSDGMYACDVCGLEYAPALSGAGYVSAGPAEEYASAPDARHIVEAGDGVLHGSSRYWLPSDGRLVMDRLRGMMVRSVLDYGCGSGRFMSLAREIGFITMGIDPDESAVRVLTEAGHAAAHGNTPDAFKGDWPHPDAIVMLRVLPHVYDPRGVLHGLRERFPKAYLFMSVPWRHQDVVYHADPRGYPPQHLTRWNRTSIDWLLRSAGYTTWVELQPLLAVDIVARCWLSRRLGAMLTCIRGTVPDQDDSPAEDRATGRLSPPLRIRLWPYVAWLIDRTFARVAEWRSVLPKSDHLIFLAEP